MGLLESMITPFIRGVMEQFFTNFDASKLDIGFGNIELTDMLIRPSLVDDSLPFTLVFGKVGKIYIQISVTTLSSWISSSVDVTVTVKDIYILLAPPTSVRYQDDTEDKLVKKRKALDDAVEKDPQIGGIVPDSSSNDPSLVVGIINNIKITVENIHVRYEDRITNPGSPFAFGITLKKLAAESTDDKWNPRATDRTALTFYKLVSLEGFGFYWNTNCGLLWPLVPTPDAQAAAVSKMQHLIDDDNKELKFLIGKLNGSMKAIVTMSPNKLPQKYSKPMADVTLGFDGFNIDITDLQVHDVLLLMQSFEDQSRRKPYLAFRPFGVPYDGYAKKWWTYSYNCVRVGVRRRTQMYDSKFLVKQQRLCKSYELEYADYRQKITIDPKLKDADRKYKALEDQISNQDILIIRKRVAFKDKLVVASQDTVKGWWSSTKVALEPEKLKKVLAEKLTPEELKEVQEYINLTPEDTATKEFPPGYTQLKFEFDLPKFVTNVRQVQSTGRELDVLQFLLKNINTSAKVFPAEKGLAAELEVGGMSITGIASGTDVPSLLKDLTPAQQKFVTLSYAKNPKDGKPGQHITIRSDRVEVIYDAPTIQKVIDCFTWPSGVELEKTKAVVGNAMQSAKNMSMSGVKDMIENTSEIFIDIQSKVPYFMLPSAGSMKKADTILVLNAGEFSLTTIPRERSVTDGQNIDNVGAADGDVSLEVLKLTYNQYVAKYSNLECFVARKGEDIDAAINHTFPPNPEGKYFLDRPVKLFSVEEMIVNVNQCIIPDDPRFPKIKLEVSIPLLDFEITDVRALKLVRLIATIPLPVMKPPPLSAFIEGADEDVFASDGQVNQLIKEATEDFTEKGETAAYDPENVPQFTNLMFHLNIKRVKVLLLGVNEYKMTTTPRLDVDIKEGNIDLKFRTYGMSADLSCGSINAAYLDAKVPNLEPGAKVYLLKTPDSTDKPLVKIHVFSISDQCPPSKVGDVRQKATIECQWVDLTLHQESLEGLLLLVERILNEMDLSKALKAADAAVPITPVVPPPSVAPTTKTKKDKTSKAVAMMKALGIKNLPNAGDILMQASALFEEFTLRLTSEKFEIAMFHVGQIIADYVDKPLKTLIYAQIKGVQMNNLVTPTFYSLIMNSDKDKPLLIAHVTLNKQPINPTDPDIEAVVTLDFPPIICMGDYLGNIIDFFGHLKNAHENYKPQKAIEQQDENTVDATASNVAPTLDIDVARAVIAPSPEDAYATDKKISMKVDIDSPKLIIVKNTRSQEAIIVDLGQLTVTNTLQEVKTAKHTAVADHMKITLDGISFARALMDPNPTKQDILASVYMLEPTQISLNVQRSLSPWCKLLPSIEVSGELKPTELKLSLLDIEVTATIIMGYAKRVEHSVDAVIAKPAGETTTDDKTQSDHATNLIVGGEDQVEGPPAAKYAADFTIMQIGLFLYHQPTVLDRQTGKIKQDPGGKLAEFYVQNVAAKFKLWDGGNMDIGSIIDELVLRDCRPESGDITDFIMKKVDPSNPKAPVLQLDFSTGKTLNGVAIYTVHATTQGLTVILYLEFVRKILDFALSVYNTLPKGAFKTKLEDASAVTLDEKKPSMKAIGIKKNDLERFGAQDKAVSALIPADLPLIKGNIKLSASEFLLLESTKSSETNAIVGYGNSTFTMDSNEGQGSWGGGTWDFGIFTGKYQQDKPYEQICHIIEPVKMTADINLTQQNGANFDIQFSEIMIHVNAGTVLLVKKFVARILEAIEVAKAARDNMDTDHEDFGEVWNTRVNSDQGYWFMDLAALTRTVKRHKMDVKATDAPLSSPAIRLPEIFKLTFPRGALIIEAGLSSKPTAMVLFDGHLGFIVQNWSSNLSVNVNGGGSLYYNNTRKGTWEYIVEPNELANGEIDRYDLNLQVIRTKPVAGKSAWAITLSSTEILEITVSKTCIEVLKALVDNFTNCLQYEISEADINTPPYIFENNVGTDVYVTLDDANTGLKYTPDTKAENGRVTVKPGEKLELGMKLQDIASSTVELKDRLLTIFIPDFHDQIHGQSFRTTISARYNGTVLFQLLDKQGKPVGMLLEIIGKSNFSTLIVARSVVQLTSQMAVPVEVITVSQEGISQVGTVEPFQSINLPLETLHNGVGGVQLQFAAEGYQTSTRTTILPVLWQRAPSVRDLVTSKSLTAGAPDGKIRIIGNAVSLPIAGTTSFGKSFSLILKPTLVVNNFLPLSLQVSTNGSYFTTIEPGSPVDLLPADTDSSRGLLFLQLEDFQNTSWTASIPLRTMSEIAQIMPVQLTSKNGQHLFFQYRPTIFENKISELSIFCPYWMVNRTGLPLSYQGENSHNTIARFTHEPNLPGPKLMAYDLDGKQKAKFTIADSEWTTGLVLDTPMTADFVCKGKEKDYEVEVCVELSPSNLTKIVTFSPKHNISNTCPFDVIVSQVGKGSEIMIPAKTTVPFWPAKRTTETASLSLKISGTEEYTTAFVYDGVHISLLKLGNKYGGLGVNISVLATKGTLTISEFEMSEVPVLIVNDTQSLELEFHQTSISKPFSVSAGKSAIYGWDDLRKPEVIEWNITSPKGAPGFPKKFKMNEASSGSVDIIVDDKATTYSFAAFISGLRTIFIVTENTALIGAIQDYVGMGKSDDKGSANPMTLDVTVELKGIGISIVDDQNCKDVLYVRFDSTPPMWEASPVGGNKFKTMAADQIVALEKGYSNYVSGKNTKRPMVLDNGIKIDYANYLMSAPTNLQLKRHAYKAGLFARIRLYEFSKDVTLSIAKLQIDNQLDEAEHPQLLAMAPIHKSVANTTEILPPLFLANMNDRTQGARAETINGEVILQEFCVAIDSTFVKNLLAVIEDSNANSGPKTKALFEYDLKRTNMTDKEYYEGEAGKPASAVSVAFYELLQTYMLKVQVTAQFAQDPDGGFFQNMLLGIGASTISVSDVPISIDGLEIANKRWTRDQLQAAVISHYKKEIMLNIYRLVLGLDLLGNPTKLLGGIGTGIKSLLTEPVQGAMNGNLIEGISNGTTAIIGGTVGGLSNALGSVSSQLGKLTKGLGLFGIHQALTGIGTGLSGLGGALGGAEKTTVHTLRPRRIMFPDQPLKPYSLFQTTGDTLYKKAAYDYNDCGPYITHYVTPLTDGTVEILLLTRGRVYCAGATPTLDSLNRKWAFAWREIEKIEKTPTNNIVFKQPVPVARGFSFFQPPAKESNAVMKNAKIALDALQQCKQTMKNATGR